MKHGASEIENGADNPATMKSPTADRKTALTDGDVSRDKVEAHEAVFETGRKCFAERVINRWLC